ncbi:ABC-2 type transport system permease protein [Polymorphobacter multimanifer]|uniref:ABC-2 type transport system permease protein n=3 Tax=Polymorphobacter multimanifer TaxID=1070431 RepID=A0A841L180_9SPHN|nr:hypothetical protein [Polymorphobacter multimanifer]MBB6226579.1 ABC-2 type transport system permease protein [Polymorphobacter multimanifer]
MAASLGHLLSNEVRIALRTGFGGSPLRSLLGLGLVAAGPVIGGWMAAKALADAPDWPEPAIMALLVAAHAALLPLMVSLASVQVLRSFRERGDLDLLLSAPLPASRVFLAKALAACWMVAMPFLALLGPFLIFSMGFGHWRWGGTLLVLLTSAGIATGLGFIVVAALIDWLGARRARLAVHLGSAALGLGIFIGTQMSGLAGGAVAGRAAMLARLAEATPPPPFDWGARAMMGEPMPLLAFSGAAGLSLLMAMGPGAQRLAVKESEEHARSTLAPMPGFHGAAASLVIKELQLLWRDPETLAQVLLRFVYLVPLLWLATRDGAAPDAIARQLLAGGVALAVMAASSLAWITVCAEEARELVEAAPVPGWQLNGAKLAVACGLPVLALVPLAIWLATLAPLAGALLLPLAAVAGLGMAMVQAWHGPRMPRTAFRKRPGAMLLIGIVEIGLAGCWAALASLIVGGSPWALLLAAIIAIVILVARAIRR